MAFSRKYQKEIDTLNKELESLLKEDHPIFTLYEYYQPVMAHIEINALQKEENQKTILAKPKNEVVEAIISNSAQHYTKKILKYQLDFKKEKYPDGYRVRKDQTRNFSERYRAYEEEISLAYIDFLKRQIAFLKYKNELEKKYNEEIKNKLHEFETRRQYFRDKIKNGKLDPANPGLADGNLGISYVKFNKLHPEFIDPQNDEALTLEYAAQLNTKYKFKINGLCEDYLANKSMSDKMEWTREQDEKNIKKQLGKLSTIAQRLEVSMLNLKKELFADETLSVFDKIKLDLSWLSFIMGALVLPVFFYRMAHAAILSDEHWLMRVMSFSMAAVGAALSVLGIVVAVGAIPIAAPILIMAGSVKAVIETGWGLGAAIHKRFFGEGKSVDAKIKELENFLNAKLDKAGPQGHDQVIEEQKEVILRLTELHNLRIRMNSMIAQKAHVFAQAALAIVGAGLLFTPAAPIGIGIILGVAAYGIVMAFNPQKYILKGITKLVNKYREYKAEKQLSTEELRDKKGLEMQEKLAVEKSIEGGSTLELTGNIAQHDKEKEKRILQENSSTMKEELLSKKNTNQVNPIKPIRKINLNPFAEKNHDDMTQHILKQARKRMTH